MITQTLLLGAFMLLPSGTTMLAQSARQQFDNGPAKRTQSSSIIRRNLSSRRYPVESTTASSFAAASPRCLGKDDTGSVMMAIKKAQGRPIILRKGQTCAVRNLSIPNLEVEEGAALKPVTGYTVVLSGTFYTRAAQPFANALPGQGFISFLPGTVREVNPQWWGAKGNGVDDDTRALNAAFAQSGLEVNVPKGLYKVTSNLARPLCGAIIGAGRDQTVFVPASGVTTFLKVSSPVRSVRGFGVDGAATRNATGIMFGDSVAADGWSSGLVAEIRVANFKGPTGVGIRVADVVKSEFAHVLAEGNGVDLLLERVAIGFPTTVTFRNCQFIGAESQGVRLLDGHSIVFDGCVFESNGAEGVRLLPKPRETLEDIAFINGCWFEDNFRTTGHSNFQLTAGDGNPTPTSTIRLILRDVFFAGGPTTTRAVLLDGGSVAGFSLENVQVPRVSDEIKIQNNAYGTIVLPANLETSVVSANEYVQIFTRGRITFPATSARSDNPTTLDDYREGSFTPTIILGGGSANSTEQKGTYTKIGRAVTAHITITIKDTRSPAGSLEIGGLPFAATSHGVASVFCNRLRAGDFNVVGEVETGKSTIHLYKFTGGSLAELGPDIGPGSILRITATYETN